MGYPKYSGLAELLKADAQALKFFEELPLEVREGIAPNGRYIDSFEALRNYADIVSGDDN